MELINATKMQAGYTQGIDKTGRESLVVVVKGTFNLPLDGSEPSLAPQQQAIVEADIATGEPGFSATLYESEYAPVKPRCDVIVVGSAYAPAGKKVNSIDVGLKVSSVQKVFTVVGNRYWYTGGGGIRHTSPEPFSKKFISYDVAFGGTDNFHPDEDKRNAYMPNPIGCGYHYYLDNDLVNNTPLPNTEEKGRSVSSPTGKYQPMGFGVMGRSWPERAKYAGTYDQKWVDETFPFLPADFDERYYQCAPQDQQCDYLKGGEWVQLFNLTPNGKTAFQIPKLEVPIVYFRKRLDDVHTKAVADTLVIEPDKGIFSICWRANLPLRKNMFEVVQVLAGKKSRAWWRARELGKTYYPSLASIGSSEDDDD